MKLSDFDYHLPEHLIAQMPPAERGNSRLLHVKPQPDAPAQMADLQFQQLLDLVSPNDLMVFNNTKVIKARLFGQKPTGGHVEVMIERVLSTHEVLAQVGASKTPKIGAQFTLEGGWEVEVLARQDDLFHLRFLGDTPVLDIVEQSGHLPLPPYINREAADHDDNRYQTVYAKDAGAVAAPTAGLHFTDAMLAALQAKGIRHAFVTLHVGAGTFQPVRVENLAEHTMHSEQYYIPEETLQYIAKTRANGGRILAVGTTSLRALESAAQQSPLQAGWQETALFITPGYSFKVVDRLLTNFHLPKSTLLMLVSAFAGFKAIQQAYQHAIQHEYRFFSYGDAMLLERANLMEGGA